MPDYDHRPADKAPNPIVGEYWDHVGPQTIPWHSHRRGQVIHVVRGCVTVETEAGLFVLPPHRAIWLPPETRHSVRYPGEVAFRGIYLASGLTAPFPPRPTVLHVDRLTRELIDKATRIAWDYGEHGPEARLFAVLIDQLVALKSVPLSLPDATDKRLRSIMAALKDNPADQRTLAAWAETVHMSERTLARHFRAETGLSFSAWRQQLRLLTALERLAAGEAITTIAIDLGYATPSSLTTMFKRAFGVAPTRFFDET